MGELTETEMWTELSPLLESQDPDALSSTDLGVTLDARGLGGGIMQPTIGEKRALIPNAPRVL
jgi:hypothetical protein